MKKTTNILFFVALVIMMVLSGCTRRPLDYDYIDTAEITVILDWSKAEINPDGATIMFYPQDDSEPIVKLTHTDTTTVELPVGFYSVIAFNETTVDFDYISFRNTDHFTTIEAYVEEESTDPTLGKIYHDPDILASASLASFQVTVDMVLETRSRSKTKTKTKAIPTSLLVTLQPQRMVYPAVVTANVDGLNRLSSAGAYITGFTEGIFLGTGRTSIYETTQKLNFTERVFQSGSQTLGYLRGTFTCFGLREDTESSEIRGYSLGFRSVLIDNNTYSKDYDISSNISTIDINIGIQININVGSGLPGDDIIVIPEAEGKSGWEIDVGEWNDIVVPIEL